MGNSRYNEDADAMERHHKNETIKRIKNDNSDWDRKTPKSEDEIAHEESENIRIYDQIIGNRRGNGVGRD